jgi:hypothetical protein
MAQLAAMVTLNLKEIDFTFISLLDFFGSNNYNIKSENPIQF